MYLVYGLLALLILGPLLLPGYILTLDMVFVPHHPWPQEVTNTYVPDAILHALGYVIAGDIVQKAVLWALLVFAGVGAHKLVAYVRSDQPNTSDVWRWAAYCAGIFYVVNPYVYGRFMAGQHLVLLGYMLLPFFARALLKFLRTPNSRQVLPVVGYAVAISVVSIHTVGFVALLAVVAGIVAVWQKRRERPYVVAVLKYSLAGCGLATALSAYWLVPLIFGRGTAAEAIGSFNETDIAAFATDGGSFNVLMLKGFWAEAQGLFTPADALLPLSGLVQLALWAVMAVGIVAAWRSARSIVLTFGIAGIVAIVCAVGLPLLQYVPLLAGYREPHKFAGVVALASAVFLAFGAAVVIQRVAHYKKTALQVLAVGILAFLPLLNTPTMPRAFNGQLMPRQYPADWYELDHYFNQDSENYKVLFLPWHLYMQFDFTGRIIANPADKFFDKPVVVSDDPEFGGITSRSSNSDKRALETLLPAAANGIAFGSRIAPLGIKYVLLAKDTGDSGEYDYLSRQQDLRLIKETPTLKLYRNAAFGAQ